MNNFTFVRLTDFDQKLPFYFSGVGYNYIQEPVVRPGKNEYQQWMFSDYQWIQTKKGSGELILNENKYIIKEGQGFYSFLTNHMNITLLVMKNGLLTGLFLKEHR